MYIFDIDGTLADPTHRLKHIIGDKKNWDAYDSLGHMDKPIYAVIGVLNALYYSGHDIMLLTGRNERVRYDTETWLTTHDVHWDELLMRPGHDFRPDTVVKLAQLDKYLAKAPHTEIQTIFDDRKRLVEAYRDRGYHVCQVAEGDF